MSSDWNVGPSMPESESQVAQTNNIPDFPSDAAVHFGDLSIPEPPPAIVDRDVCSPPNAFDLD